MFNSSFGYMGTTKYATDIDYESIFCCDVNYYTIVQINSQNTGATSTQLKSSSQRASTTSTLSSLAIRLAR
ncbi:hypothetical protein RGQ29_032773 [Quercus rubra]|uniref:Uncharacterized protein n=1 Tax=Quercus rubra TaxID=3512 RepID=A0AAN7DUS2_QUERU|nr:hypothetical protein RGQ29_032773 [Quercus rubra]